MEGEAAKPDVQATLVAAIFPPSLQSKRKLFSTSVLYLVSVNPSIFRKYREQVRASQITLSTAAAIS